MDEDVRRGHTEPALEAYLGPLADLNADEQVRVLLTWEGGSVVHPLHLRFGGDKRLPKWGRLLLYKVTRVVVVKAAADAIAKRTAVVLFVAIHLRRAVMMRLGKRVFYGGGVIRGSCGLGEVATV